MIPDLSKLAINRAVEQMAETIEPTDTGRYHYAKTTLTAVVQNTTDQEARQACVIALRVLSASEQLPAAKVALEDETMTAAEVIEWLSKVGWLRSDIRVSLTETELRLWLYRRRDRIKFSASEQLVADPLVQLDQEPLGGDLDQPGQGST